MVTVCDEANKYQKNLKKCDQYTHLRVLCAKYCRCERNFSSFKGSFLKAKYSISCFPNSWRAYNKHSAYKKLIGCSMTDSPLVDGGNGTYCYLIYVKWSGSWMRALLMIWLHCLTSYLKKVKDGLSLETWRVQFATESGHRSKHLECMQMLLITISVVGSNSFPGVRLEQLIECVLDERRRLELWLKLNIHLKSC